MPRPFQLACSIYRCGRQPVRAAGWALLAASLLMLVFVLLAPAAHAQISPGPLSKFHRDLDGPSGCTKCHAVSAGSPDFRCLDCHTEIASRLRDRRGLHPALIGILPTTNSLQAGVPHPSPSGEGANATQLNAACVRCHSEHNGENFVLTKWNPTPNGYDHSKTGFILDGKHAGLACNKCHNPQHISPVERAALASKNLATTFLGVSRDCITCHEDKHRGQLGANCLQCHNTTDWKSSRTTFDHSKTKFALRGAHVRVACAKCHTPQQDGTPKYVGLKFDRCAACHTDPHRAAFPGQTCENCHNVSGWKETHTFRANFDHSKTKYALLGKHLEVGCQQCHRRADFKTAIAHDFCADCHKPDPHNGQFARRTDGGRCESCHTVDGFKTNVKFALAEHNTTGFPLRGRHATLDCAKCHTPRGRATLFKIKFSQCLDCHRDIHGGQFARAPYMNRCEQCHTEQSFHPATFTLARHQHSTFVLTGGHMAVACTECHKPEDASTVGISHPAATPADSRSSNIGASTQSPALYHWQSVACTSCHSDPHRNQFAPRMAKIGPNGRTVGCEACHSTKNWSDLQRFDHANTRFALTGTHRAVDCASCHRPPNLERKLLNVDFKSAPSQCEGCHEDPHGAQFAHFRVRAAVDSKAETTAAPASSVAPQGSPSGSTVPHICPPLADVGVCTTGALRSATLAPVTSGVPHPSPTGEGANVEADGTPSGGAANDAVLAPHCADCHNTNKWRPSSFDHEKTAFSLRGAHANVRCTACHTLKREVNDKSVLFYRPTPTACAACHGNRITTATGS